MHIKSLIISVIALLCAGELMADDATSANLSRREVLSLLPQGVDMDERAAERYRRLLALGDASHPFLAEIAAQTDDRFLLGTILGILERTGERKAIARSLAHGILQRFRDKVGVDAEVIRQHAVRTLGTIGTKEDIPALLPLLESEEEFLRTNAIRSLGMLGDEATAVKIQQSLQNVTERPNINSLEKQRAREERDSALQKIQNRLSEKKQPQGPKGE